MAGFFFCSILTGGSLVRSVSALSLSTTTAATTKRIAVIGGGASGIFSAISAAEHYVNQAKTSNRIEIVVLEATSKTLTKVSISGGGRCNVLHDTSKPTSEILNGYPRGKKELTGLLSSRFTPQQAQEWFLNHGVKLKTEPDGRMFPITDSSQTVIDALLKALETTGGGDGGGIATIHKRQKVSNIAYLQERGGGGGCFQVTTQSKTPKDSNQKTPASRQEMNEIFDAVILATGSSPVGYQLAQSILEQAAAAAAAEQQSSENSNKKKKQMKKKKDIMVSPVPSLFTMNTKLDIKEEGCLLYGLAGVSVPNAHVYFKPEENNANKDGGTAAAAATTKRKRAKKPAHLQQEGPLLVTHHGVSGPAVLRLSAFGARDFHDCNYRGTLHIHWAPSLGTAEDITNALWKMTQTNPKKNVATGCPLTVTTTVKEEGGFVKKKLAAIPKRLWSSLVVNGCDVESTTEWGQVNKKAVRKLATLIAECKLQVTGKGTFKEEFVTAGGVSLNQMDMKSMMSKTCPGIFFCGEVINVDGVTGGFNFMNCWGTGRVAGTSAVDFVLSPSSSEEEQEEEEAETTLQSI